MILKKTIMLGLLVIVVLSTMGLGKEIVVTSTADSGTGSLRWALQVTHSGDTITFDPKVFPPDDPSTIYPQSELPPITRGGVTIDASNVGVVIDGSKVPGDWNNGIQVYSEHNVIRGLQIVNFMGSGIVIGRASWNTVDGDRGIGSGPLGKGNLVSGNGIGIDICDYGTPHNVIQGNLIGTEYDGKSPRGNSQQGIWIKGGCSDNTIGPSNIIAYNGWCGIEISGKGSSGNTITRNSIYGNGNEEIRFSSGAIHRCC